MMKFLFAYKLLLRHSDSAICAENVLKSAICAHFILWWATGDRGGNQTNTEIKYWGGTEKKI